MPYFYTKKIAGSLCLCLLFILESKHVVGQYKLIGKVIDSTNAPIPYAAVGIMYAKDSALVIGVLCNDSGEFVMNNIKPGIYIPKVEATGYIVQYGQPIKVDSSAIIRITPIQLKSQNNNLKSVNVTADKPFMEHKADKTIFNVENSIIATGKNALELLNNLPGVSSNDNGNISVLGKPGVLIMVNGKPINTDAAAFLKGIDASQIEKIEVITNPSAKYAAAANAVINIILKRDKNMGLNGELYTGCTEEFYVSLNESQSINYRTKKWDFSLDCSEYVFHRYFTHTITKTLSDGNNTPEIFEENAPWIIHGSYSFGTVGVDYMPDKKQTISFSSDFEIQYEKLNTYDNTIIHTPTSSIDSSLYSQNIRNYRALHAMPSITYKYKPDSTDKELDILLLYGPYSQTDNQSNPVNYYTPIGQELRPSTLFNSNQVISMNDAAILQIDYTQPITTKIKLDAGIYEQYAKPENNAQFWNVENGVQIVDTTKTNQFDFTENILAGYLNYSQKLNKKVDFQVGLRAEQTNDFGTQLVHDTSFTRNYFNLFPSASFNWQLSANHTFSISYTRRINRPDYTDLNPFITVIDPYTYSVGNIALLPSISDHYEFDYTFKQYFNISLGHDYYNNVIKQAYYQNDSTHITYAKMENMNYYNGYNIMLSLSIPITKWWSSITSVNIYHDDYHDVIAGENLNLTNTSITLKTLNTFTWKNKFDVELSFLYNSSDLEGVSLTQPINDLEVGISKKLFNDRLIIKASASDILKGMTNKTSTVYQGLNVQEVNYYDDQNFKIGITWKFGKSEYHRDNSAKPNLLKGGKT